MDDAELLAWLRLTQASGVGPVALRRLLQALGSPQAVLAAAPATWRDIAGAAAARGLAESCAVAQQALAATRAWQDHAPERRHVLSWADDTYPQALLNTADPPPLLWAEGSLALLARPALAIVGSRHASAQGLDNARAFARHLSQAGLTIVSGMALGIDGAAHEGALQAPASTIAVVGTGPDVVYPPRHAALWQRVAESGLLLSEFAPGTPPLPSHFPRRNRVIAGLSLGTLVVEAALQSGSLITARLALECDRDVFALPGSIHAPQSRGCLQLIQQGAKLVVTAEDILAELPALRLTPPPVAADPPPPAQPTPAPPSQDEALWRALGHDPVSLDQLIGRCGWDAARLQARLLELELDGQVARLPGGVFQRRGCA